MSTLIVDVTPVVNIKNHPNADRLSITTVKGWDIVTAKKEDGSHAYATGDLVVYCPIDGVLPKDLSDKLEVTKYLANGRVKTAKLRGFYSQGLIIPLQFLPPGDYPEGIEVGEILGISKYELPVKLTGGGEAWPDDGRFIQYTKVENIKNFPDVLEEEEVAITEKIHGSNFRCAKLNDGTFRVGSHQMNLKENEKNIYWKVARMYNLEEILEPGQQVFGEVYGVGVQKLHYGAKNKIDLALFDLIEEGLFVDVDYFLGFCESENIPHAPLLYTGPWSKILMSLADGQTAFDNAQHIREGFVVRPMKERAYKGRRVIYKHISEKYLLKDYGDLIAH